ncbi:MAG: hypothetical protein AB1711_12630 [Thermodesulfobacteriota bacterium]
MKQAFGIFSCLWIILISGLHAETVQQQTPLTSKGKVVIVDKSTGAGILIMPGQAIVASKGETVVVAKSAKFNVQVKIRTYEVQIGKPSDKRPDVIRSSCTYSKYPCSIVDYIDIIVNDKAILVPRSVFCDLADLNTAEVKIEQKKAILTLTGGDASESYIVKIEFDKERVKRRVTSSGMLPDEPSQETIYHLPILKDE